ncbi:hypothetical protein Q5H91_07700 [Sphingomonas sp. KR1UV-12]|uniref:STAS/SEC14 domain-containing protein n=2 Tax=Sphingomonas aurea TaxID=3063994 RepID=A0ABT9EJE2_9SPHN|nr:hypothetical protein [Sphingomonas sp. KR1UV-12]
MYTVTIEPALHLLRIRVAGFWSAAVMKAYVAELVRQAEALGRTGGCRRILVNMSDYPIQAQAIADGHARIIAHGKTVMKAHTAVVMKSALSRLQAMRVADLAGHELFDDEVSARRWLMSMPAGAAAGNDMNAALPKREAAVR